MDLTSILTQLATSGVLTKASLSHDIPADKLTSVLMQVAPAILSQLGQNAKDPIAAQSLNSALDQHDGSILGSLDTLLSPAQETDGGKIIEHIFGNKKGEVVQNIAQKSNIDSAHVLKVLAFLAPLIMGYLGSQKKELGTDQSGLESLVKGASSQIDMSSLANDLMKSMLNNGSVKDAVVNAGISALKRKLFG